MGRYDVPFSCPMDPNLMVFPDRLGPITWKLAASCHVQNRSVPPTTSFKREGECAHHVVLPTINHDETVVLESQPVSASNTRVEGVLTLRNFVWRCSRSDKRPKFARALTSGMNEIERRVGKVST